MTNEELAERLNAKTGSTGKAAVTVDVIRQWVAWDVLPKASAKGRTVGLSPEWWRSAIELQRALRLAELRKRDVIRQTAVIVQAYIEWGHPDFDRVKHALAHEIKRGRRRLTRGHITFVGNADYDQISRAKHDAIEAQLGPLDSRFVGTQFEQAPKLYALLAEAARNGSGHLDQLQRLITVAFERIAPGISEAVPKGVIANLTNSIFGITGEPDEIENSAQSEIAVATEAEFKAARHSARRFLRMPRLAKRFSANRELPNGYSDLLQQFGSVWPQISIGEWASFLLAECILHVRRNRQAPEK